MKNKLYIALFIAMWLFSCGSDDNDSTDNGNINPKMEEDTIIGKWKLISVTEDNETELASNCEKKSII